MNWKKKIEKILFDKNYFVEHIHKDDGVYTILYEYYDCRGIKYFGTLRGKNFKNIYQTLVSGLAKYGVVLNY